MVCEVGELFGETLLLGGVEQAVRFVVEGSDEIPVGEAPYQRRHDAGALFGEALAQFPQRRPAREDPGQAAQQGIGPGALDGEVPGRAPQEHTVLGLQEDGVLPQQDARVRTWSFPAAPRLHVALPHTPDNHHAQESSALGATGGDAFALRVTRFAAGGLGAPMDGR